MHEQSKAAHRRSRDWHFVNLYFVGAGIDIGAGPDGLSKLRSYYPQVTSVRDWDVEDGDAHDLEGVPDGTFDFVSASHVLEHLERPIEALRRWFDVLKPRGHLIVTLPEYEMYERGYWPSRFGVGHLRGYTPRTNTGLKHVDSALNLLDAISIRRPFSIERIAVIREHFDPHLSSQQDQTLGPAECAIELVLRK